MADTVDSQVIRNTPGRYTIHLQNQSDGSGESGVTKIDISTLTNSAGAAATYSMVERIDYNVWGFNYVALKWDHNTDDEIATLSGSGFRDYTYEGGQIDPKTTGGTGDVLLTTSGTDAGSGYDILLRMKMK